MKADDDASPIMRLIVTSSKLSESEMTDLAKGVIEDRLSAVEGVASATSYGLRARTIEVRANQVALAARGLAISDLMAAIAKASVSAPSGALENATQQLLVRAEAPVATPDDVGKLELTPTTRVSDVAYVRWAFQDATAITRLDGKTAIGVEIIRQAQSNTIAISDAVRRTVDELRRALPAGVEIAVVSDDAIFIREAVTEVISSLLIATAIVILVILLFLASIGATIAPAVAIPISLVGTLAMLWAVGFSINILTLLAFVVATGIVVDDAIVVIENIARHRAMGAGPRAAAVNGTREIIFAVLSTTATLAAVFVPVSFMPGVVGNLFSEFGFVLAFAVAMSSFVALTLCPMLASKLGTGSATKSRDPRPLRSHRGCGRQLLRARPRLVPRRTVDGDFGVRRLCRLRLGRLPHDPTRNNPGRGSRRDPDPPLHPAGLQPRLHALQDQDRRGGTCRLQEKRRSHRRAHHDRPRRHQSRRRHCAARPLERTLAQPAGDPGRATGQARQCRRPLRVDVVVQQPRHSRRRAGPPLRGRRHRL